MIRIVATKETLEDDDNSGAFPASFIERGRKFQLGLKTWSVTSRERICPTVSWVPGDCLWAIQVYKSLGKEVRYCRTL